MTNNYTIVPVGDNLTIRQYPKPPKKRAPKPITERLCPHCTTVYPIASFESSSGKRYPQCKSCRTARSKADYRASRRKHLDRKAIKEQLLQQFGSQCERCGYNEFDSALEFHHRNPREKDSTISQLIGRYATSPTEDNWDTLVAEAGKCDVYCSNCHQSLHAKDW